MKCSDWAIWVTLALVVTPGYLAVDLTESSILRELLGNFLEKFWADI
jgi:hypothetical protein